MFFLAFAVGIFPYVLFLLGILNLFYKNLLIVVSIAYWVIIGGIFLYRKKIFLKNFKFEFSNKFINLCIVLLLIQAIINLIGALGPELAFDALWYHLTIPKIYLQNHKIFFIPGGLFYYSAMPKLIEIYFALGLAFGSEVFGKLMHFMFGVLSCFALYKLARLYLSQKLSWLVVVIFYSNLVVAWLSITAYIDLGRCFFEILALFSFVLFQKTNMKKWLIVSSAFVGFAIVTKLLAFGTLFLFVILFLSLRNKNKKEIVLNILVFVLLSLLVVSPWLLFSFITTGNPIFPLLTNYKVEYSTSLLSPLFFLITILNLFIFSADPISPVYLIVLPLVFINLKKLSSFEKTIFLYCAFALFIWYITPQSGGGRFIVAYLPAFSLLVGIILNKLKSTTFSRIMIVVIVSVSIISIMYRFAANSKYIPVLLSRETKADFLAKNLNFNFGDYYDIDGSIEKSIHSNYPVLFVGGHNLYYVTVPFVHESYAPKGFRFDYIIVQNEDLDKRFANETLLYENKVTKVKLYKNQNGVWEF